VTVEFAHVPISEMRPEALEKAQETARLRSAAISSGRKAVRMTSNWTNYTRLADGVRHVHKPIADGDAHTPRRFVGRATLRSTGLLVLAVLAALALATGARAQAPVFLGTADNFGVLGATTVTNTGPTVINGDVGLSPGTSVTGFFPPGTVTGTIHAADAVAAQAQTDLTDAYNVAAGRPCDTLLQGQDLGGMTLTHGIYCFSSSAGLTGTLTLDGEGDPNAVFIFQIGSTLTTASASRVNFINGAQSCLAVWQVGSSATLGTTTAFGGSILALTSITATTGATVDGRLLARNGAVTLDTNTVTNAQCAAGTVVGDADETPGVPGTGAADQTGPLVAIAGAPGDGIAGNPVRNGPKPCLATDFRLRIRARDISGIRRVSVYLDGRLIKRSTQRQFYVWIRAERLLSLRHTIRVVARDREGNRSVLTRRFTRCDRPVLQAFPAFTG
jgi:hypothetical protein